METALPPHPSVKSGVVRTGLRVVAVPICLPWLLELDWVFLSQGLGKGNRNFLCGSCMFTPELYPFPHRKQRVGLTEIFHDLMMSLKCSIKIKKKLLQMENIRFIGFSDCCCNLASIMYYNWEGGVSAPGFWRPGNSCQKLVRFHSGCSGQVAGGEVGWVEGRRPGDSD